MNVVTRMKKWTTHQHFDILRIDILRIFKMKKKHEILITKVSQVNKYQLACL